MKEHLNYNNNNNYNEYHEKNINKNTFYFWFMFFLSIAFIFLIFIPLLICSYFLLPRRYFTNIINYFFKKTIQLFSTHKDYL